MKIKLTCFWEDDESIFQDFLRYGFGSSVWKDMELVRGEDYDRLVILTRPHADCKPYKAAKAITFLTEPPSSVGTITHETSAVIPMYLPLPFWAAFGQPDRDRVRTPGVLKTHLLSSVTSGLALLEGHRARLQLVHLLDQRISEGFDLWGRAYGNPMLEGLQSYKGPLENKYDALWSYQYHFACENSMLNDYFTEKITDPILAECLCFYDGCQNLEAYIDERAFIRVDVFDPLRAIEQMIDAIGAEEWERRIPFIRQQKKRLLTDLNPLNIIWLSVMGRDVQGACRL